MARVFPEAAEHYRRQQRLAILAALAARRAWRATVTAADLDRSWQTFLTVALPLIVFAQSEAATAGAAWPAVALAAQDLPDNPTAEVAPAVLAGVASDGRDLSSLLYSSVTDTKTAIGKGRSLSSAFDLGSHTLEMLVLTQVADAGRAATAVGVAVRPSVGYVRHVNLPSCSRCVILAGRFYRWSDGFQRHPRCDCVNVPTGQKAAAGLITDPKAAFDTGEVRGLSQADRRAVTLGADLNQVVNARRGMSTAQVYGRTLKITTEGTTARGIAGQRLGERQRTAGTPRLMPDSIFRLSGGNRDEALRLLRRFGYVL